MVFVGALILPHGTMTFDSKDSTEAECRQRHLSLPIEVAEDVNSLYSGCLEAAEKLAQLEPDLILFHTPHGMTTSQSMTIYNNPDAEGSALWNGQWQQYQVSIDLHQELSQALHQHFVDYSNIPTHLLTTFSGLSCPLRWGEVVPLWFFLQKCKKKPKFVIMTNARTSPTSELDPEKLQIGHLIAQFVANLEPELKVGLVISGDLSHTYSSSFDDSLYMPDERMKSRLQPNNKAALDFESCILNWICSCDLELEAVNNRNSISSKTLSSQWVFNPETSRQWLNAAQSLQSEAKACGLNGSGFQFLHGFLEDIGKRSGQTFKSRIYTCRAPTYYGMLAASFIP